MGKTLYGEVVYSRHVYLSKTEECKNVAVYLLDKGLGMDTISTVKGDTDEEKKASELKEYLENHKDELARYHTRGKEIPEPPQGMVYKNMGVQENQNCTLITLRMKGNRKRWGEKSAANMIRLLYYRENKELMDAEPCTAAWKAQRSFHPPAHSSVITYCGCPPFPQPLRLTIRSRIYDKLSN